MELVGEHPHARGPHVVAEFHMDLGRLHGRPELLRLGPVEPSEEAMPPAPTGSRRIVLHPLDAPGADVGLHSMAAYDARCAVPRRTRRRWYSWRSGWECPSPFRHCTLSARSAFELRLGDGRLGKSRRVYAVAASNPPAVFAPRTSNSHVKSGTTFGRHGLISDGGLRRTAQVWGFKLRGTFEEANVFARRDA